ncbi:CerR family C-terminal domain-containing protein [Pararhizobium haloflavum]|uniref:CerR family C-terminal domain-containing protein n=1 Tax=Pararhizobium haloflavum TaxID=2037914 RepID=UPI000C1A2A7D|nr:CerR family C-terminal domain-containing protein [Pararhizobium haloflavum]
MSNDISQRSSAAETKAALIDAALRLFADKGFQATSTREIASAASANIGSIAYHFGGKDRLYVACAEHIVTQIDAVVGDAFKPDVSRLPAPLARMAMTAAIRRVVRFVVTSEQAGSIVQFVLRELQHPGEALDTIYGGVFEPVHRRVCAVWERVTGEPAESERTRLTVFTLIGQIVYFRIAREAVRRRMGWTAFGDREAEAIAEIAEANLNAIIAARKEGVS